MKFKTLIINGEYFISSLQQIQYFHRLINNSISRTSILKSLIGHLETGGIIVTYYCNSQCKHCIQNASPHRAFEFISPQKLEEILHKLQHLGCKSIHLEGGEPFLFPDELIHSVKIVKAMGFNLEHIVTNGSWYRNESDALNLLTELKQNGLNRLVIKFLPFHNEFVPLSKITKITKVASKAGINCLILGVDYLPQISALNQSKTHSLKEYENAFGRTFLQQVASGFEIPLSARSFNLFPRFLKAVSLPEILNNSKDCKKELRMKHHFHIDLYGNYIFPSTKGLTLPIDEIEKSKLDERFPFAKVLHDGGINNLFQLAVKDFNYKPKQEYLSKCHFCFDIRQYLVNECNVNSPDLQPIELYKSNSIR